MAQGLKSNILIFLEEEGKRRKKKSRPIESQIVDHFGREGITPIQMNNIRAKIRKRLKLVGVK